MSITIQELRIAYLDKWTTLDPNTGERTPKQLTQTDVNNIVLNEITTLYDVLISIENGLNTLNTNLSVLAESTQTSFTNVSEAISQMNTTMQTNIQTLSQQINDNSKSQNSVINVLSKSFDKQIQKLQKSINTMVRK